MNINLVPRIVPRNDDQRRADIQRRLISREAELGGQLFGLVPKGHHRQFFCLDAHTWIWHEEWKDAKGQHRAVTTRYEVRPDGVIKSQDGQNTYQLLSPNEARHLFQASELYRRRVGGDYRRRLQLA